LSAAITRPFVPGQFRFAAKLKFEFIGLLQDEEGAETKVFKLIKNNEIEKTIKKRTLFMMTPNYYTRS